MATRLTFVDPKWDERLRPHYLTVAEHLHPRKNRLPALLYQERLLTGDEQEHFDTIREQETDVALLILSVLRNQPEGSFDKFCNVLLQVPETRLHGIVKLLRSNDGGESSMGGHETEQNSSQASALPQPSHQQQSGKPSRLEYSNRSTI